MSINDVRSGTLQLGAFTLPLSGTDSWYRITSQPKAEVVDVLDGNAVKNVVPYRRATLTVSAMPGSVAHALIRQISTADDVLNGRLNLGGAAFDGSSAQTATWGNAFLTQEPDMVVQKTAEPAEATFELTQYRVVQPVAALILAQAGT